MPLFQIDSKRLTTVTPSEFELERHLQTLIEDNLETVFNCRLVATEFATGARHAGRIDSLGLSEENNPVIIEYKKIHSSELVTQALYYLSWMDDHRGDFQVAVEKKLGKKTEVDWSDIRVICLAPGYKKFDLHAVQMMGANIELWEYHLYSNGAFLIEEVFKRRGGDDAQPISAKRSPKVALAVEAQTQKEPPAVEYTVKAHAEKARGELYPLVIECREYILSLSDAIEEVPKKQYVAYKVAQNFVCLEVHQHKFYLYLKVGPEEFAGLPPNARDVRMIGHFGTGELELTISTAAELEEAKEFVRRALARVGGG